MNSIKVEVDEMVKFSCDNSCFICLHSVTQINQEGINSLHFFFNYLTTGEETKDVFVCEECGEKLKKFEKLCNILEKVSLEMDYLLGFLQSTISNSNGRSGLGPFLLRESVAKKCGEKVLNPKPQIDLGNLPEPLRTDSDHVSSSTDMDTTTSTTPVCFEVKIEVKTPPKGNEKQNLSTASTSKPVNPSKFFKCPTCPKVFSENCRMRNHFNQVHLRLKPYKCDICGKSFARAYHLKVHKATPHHPKSLIKSSKTFHCEKCEKTFVNVEGLKSHERDVHSGKGNKFPCHICNKMFKKRGHVQRHISSVHDKQRHYCQVPNCARSFSQPVTLTNHYRLCHPDLIAHK